MSDTELSTDSETEKIKILLRNLIVKKRSLQKRLDYEIIRCKIYRALRIAMELVSIEKEIKYLCSRN